MRRHATIAVLLLVAAACSRAPDPGAPPAGKPPDVPVVAVAAGDPIEGERIATRVGCNGCHGPGGRGEIFMERPGLGRVVAPNLTQRRALYDDAGLEALLRHGRTHDGHLPFAMPIKMFQHLSDHEVRDITAWLRALPAVDNPELPATALDATVVAQLAEGTFPYLDDMKPDPDNRPPAARPAGGAALGRHLAFTTCGECHGWDLKGWEGDPAPSLLVVARAYSPEAFRRLMREGTTLAGGDSKPTGLMSAVARYRFKSMTDEEIDALHAFLVSQ
ncbi:cytochrome c [Pseudoxanthomonas daejeonensis]|uniref:cytochrome c4 n=1 Tax=Pseudoxanthomonas daejeonensis TaxID=266062 RepID=UPI001F545960|nr:cytochrome c [Pseudoxanthomonas daejeonensis]UNK56659.1 cytochrome c [Pseudoxanthomonas daejeonensis]